jgi:multidrug efflux system membrane fusion protein
MPRPSPLPRPRRAFVALAALLVLAGCEANTAPAPKSERPVQVQRVSFQSADRAREFVGLVRPRYETDLGFRVAGKIVTRIVNVGSRRYRRRDGAA